MKKIIAIITVVLTLTLMLTGCGHEHIWNAASCIAPKTCSECGKTEGSALQHQWQDATCEVPVTCVLCGSTAGNPIGHVWQDATCLKAKECTVCSKQEGEPKAHVWSEATCTDAKTCAVCSVTDGEPLGHKWKEATYSAPKTCSECGKTEGSALVRPEAKVVGFYMKKASTTLQFSSDGSVFHRCDDSKWTGTWSISGNTISFSLWMEGFESPLYETATLSDNGIIWDGSFYQKVS